MNHLHNKRVQLIGQTSGWHRVVTRMTMYRLDPITPTASPVKATIFWELRSIKVFRGGPEAFSVERVMPHDSTLRDLELAVYDILVEQGVLDPMVAVLL